MIGVNPVGITSIENEVTVENEAEIMPPLPVHPEQMITLSKENRKTIEASLLSETERNQELGKRRAMAWTIFASLLFLIGVVLITYWMIREYRRLHPPMPVAIPKRDLAAELILLEANDMTLSMRFCKLGQLLRELLAECMGKERASFQGKTVPELKSVIDNNRELFGADKEPLQGLLEFLDVVEFSPGLSPAAMEEQDWRSYVDLLRRLLR